MFIAAESNAEGREIRRIRRPGADQEFFVADRNGPAEAGRQKGDLTAAATVEWLPSNHVLR
jgi:hypothetical protein